VPSQLPPTQPTRRDQTTGDLSYRRGRGDGGAASARARHGSSQVATRPVDAVVVVRSKATRARHGRQMYARRVGAAAVLLSTASSIGLERSCLRRHITRPFVTAISHHVLESFEASICQTRLQAKIREISCFLTSATFVWCYPPTAMNQKSSREK
jgi:hypothetical protein